MRERFGDLEVHDRDGNEVKLTEAKWKRFTGALAEFEGWFGAAALRLRPSRRRARDRAPARRARGAHAGRGREGAREPAVERLHALGARARRRRREGEGRSRSRRRRRRPSCSPPSCSSSPIYTNLRKAYARLVEIVGPPPFTLALGKKTRRGADVLRRCAAARSTSRRRSASSSRASRASAR